MANLLWLNWSGGGNLPPSLGIARELTRRGHRVAFAGRPEMVDRVEAAGFRAIEIDRAYEQVHAYPPGSPLVRMACYLTSPAVEAQVREIVARERPDALLIDSMFPAALHASSACGLPSAVFFHHALFRLREQWRGTGERLGGMRMQAGFGTLPDFETLWKQHDRIVVTTPQQFDMPADPDWESVVHVGPVLEDEPCAAPLAEPPDADPSTPLVLVSFSTAPEQRSLEKVQQTLDALGELPVRAVATTAGVVEIDELRIPHNVRAVHYAAHDPILQKASLLITHGGHGTLMRALRAGVPMILLPGPAHDQRPNAALMHELGAAIALEGDAQSAQIANAARTILQDPAYAIRARELGEIVRSCGGAFAAADEVESLLAGKRAAV